MGFLTSPSKLLGKLTNHLSMFVMTLGSLILVANPVMAAGPVIINEFLADAVSITDASGEWVELYNSGDETVDLFGWKIEDEEIADHILLLPGTVALICRQVDSNLNGGLENCANQTNVDFSLSNSGEELVLVDDENNVVDQFTYQGADEFPGDSTIPQRNNQTLEVEGFVNDDVNRYDDTEETNNHGTPGEITLFDIINLRPEFETLNSLINLADSTECPVVESLMTIRDDEALTVFAPTNTALAGLPDLEIYELSLEENLDELCVVLANHIVVAQEPINSTDVPNSAVSLPTAANDFVLATTNYQVVARKSSGQVMVNDANVIMADIEAVNGVVHAINKPLLPNDSVITIDPVVSKSQSPMLSGTYDLETEQEFGTVCILVRVNGKTYYPPLLEKETGSWSIPAGMLEVNPKSNPLVSVVLREGIGQQCPLIVNVEEEHDTTYGDELLALSMANDIFSVPSEPEKPSGNVLGDTDTKQPDESPVYVGKGDFGDDSLYDNDGDNDDGSQNDDGDTDNGQSDNQTSSDTDNDNETWYWWFVGGGTAALLWYILWRRQEPVG